MRNRFGRFSPMIFPGQVLQIAIVGAMPQQVGQRLSGLIQIEELIGQSPRGSALWQDATLAAVLTSLASDALDAPQDAAAASGPTVEQVSAGWTEPHAEVLADLDRLTAQLETVAALLAGQIDAANRPCR